MLRVPCAWDHPCEMPCKLPHKTFSIQLCHWINSKNSCRGKKHGFCHGRPIFQELCSPADANCCSVFAHGFNWMVHLCHCADYFALINTCRAAATTASLQPIWNKLWTWVLLRQLETARLTWMFPTIFIPNSPPNPWLKPKKEWKRWVHHPGSARLVRIAEACLSQGRKSGFLWG